MKIDSALLIAVAASNVVNNVGVAGQAYAATVRDFYHSWNLDPPSAYHEGKMTREMGQVLHDYYITDPFNNVIGVHSMVHRKDHHNEPSRLDVIRAFNDVRFLGTAISARESALVRAVRLQQDPSAEAVGEAEHIGKDEAKADDGGERNSACWGGRDGCFSGSGTKALRRSVKKGFDDVPSCVFGPLLFVEYLTAALVTFVLSLVNAPPVSTAGMQAELRNLRRELINPKMYKDKEEDEQVKYQVKKCRKVLRLTNETVMQHKVCAPQRLSFSPPICISLCVPLSACLSLPPSVSYCVCPRR